MKLLIIATTKFELDGITNVILNYYRAIDKSDMQIDFVIPNVTTEALRKEIEANGSRIYVIGNRMKNPLNYTNKLSEIITKNEYEIVHAHGNSCTLALEMMAAKKGNAKLRIAHSHNSTNKYKLVHKLLRIPFDKTYTHAFACGKEAGIWLFDGKPFNIINNGINIDKYIFDERTRNEIRKKFDYCNNKVIGHVGHFSYQKNHEFLIDIFYELYKYDKSYRLLLIGDGNNKSEIEKKVRDLDLSGAVNFMGKSNYVSELMQAMDILLMPSRFEGLPLTLVEAQASGLRCIVSDVITKEAQLTDLIKFVSLEEDANFWASQVESTETGYRNESRLVLKENIIQSGFDINENALQLKLTYIENLRNL